jgi:tRNA threonylcarbamoyladenosine biosynthesis protein TsaB
VILGIDSTTERLHLALVEEGVTWARRVDVGVGRSHSGALLPALQDLLREAGRGREAIGGVAACVGPGGFTSLRIGVATAEGLALAGIPTWGFSAFRLRAQALREGGFRGPAWILLDGQRGEAFTQLWDEGPLGTAAKHAFDTLPGLLEGRPWWAPDPFRSRLEPLLGPAVPLDEEGATLAALASLCRVLPATPAETPLHPFYLRETDAEVKFPEASRHLSEALRRGHAR